MNAHQDIEKDLHGPERQFAITSWAVKNRTTVIVLTAADLRHGHLLLPS
jgi:hypothetical protein